MTSSHIGSIGHLSIFLLPPHVDSDPGLHTIASETKFWLIERYLFRLRPTECHLEEGESALGREGGQVFPTFTPLFGQ